ncbi:YggS family pyridoxal phosphate-dependent enzyme [Mesoaciditoga lauensis]|uniref:YggS family pyridoxal phosphate-dependent enzyme n=1 Tax=Mesoaciditoga lauensis TaxID=1495039 RepID=UPI00055FB357
MSNITHNVKEILSEIPEYVHLVAVAKTRTAEEIEEAIRAGVKIIGENYVQEAEKVFPLVKEKAEWHFIGSMQKNKINKIIRIFDMIETINSFEMAEEVDKRCAKIGRIMPILIEVNSGREPQKSGVMPEDVKEVVTRISTLKNVRILGLMTMGPRTGDPEEARPYFKLTKEIFDEIKEAQIPNVSMKFLSMGMSNSYKVAIEEGANVVRIGTKIFGERIYKK